MSLPSEPEANEFRFEVLRVDGEFLSGSYRSSTDLGEIQSVRFTEAGSWLPLRVGAFGGNWRSILSGCV